MTLPRPEFKRKAVRSYVIRAGRMTDAQRRALERYWPRYGLSLAQRAVAWETVFGRRAPVVLEIGFGNGESLLEMAAASPELDFVGIEVHPPGVGHLLREAAARGVENLRVYMADAVDVLEDCIPPASLARVQIFFPDPWPKKRHHKRRLIQPPFVALVGDRLAPGGVLHLATDWEEYAHHMLAVLSAAEGLVNLAPSGGFAERPPHRPATKFERRGEALGHRVWDLLFARTG